MSLNILDANQDYLLCHMMSVQLMKPVVRVFKRANSFLSIGHAEFTFSDFVDQGAFMQFISVRDNYILLKTSDYFSIIRVGSQDLIINATDYESLKRYQGRSFLDHTFELKVFAKDMY